MRLSSCISVVLLLLLLLLLLSVTTFFGATVFAFVGVLGFGLFLEAGFSVLLVTGLISGLFGV